MRANSHPVTSNQTRIHDQLHALVARHATTDFLKPVSAYNKAAFDASIARWRAAGERPLILDAGCGMGLSTFNLALQFPDHFVIGVDQSAHRLAHNTVWPGALPDNCLCVRADLVDYWRLLHAAGIRLSRHYILYPNPWPKSRHLRRRWHGHPVFPTVVALGGRLEYRSNWHIYIEECAAALSQLSNAAVRYGPHVPSPPITPFEQKYFASGHVLWRCEAQLAE
jgi:tRNA G46 methylase TrmB